jgi:hypothetical protein
MCWTHDKVKLYCNYILKLQVSSFNCELYPFASLFQNVSYGASSFTVCFALLCGPDIRAQSTVFLIYVGWE